MSNAINSAEVAKRIPTADLVAYLQDQCSYHLRRIASERLCQQPSTSVIEWHEKQAECFAQAAARIASFDAALDPFARVAAINAPLASDWPDTKPNHEFIPKAWPNWGDFKRAARERAS